VGGGEVDEAGAEEQFCGVFVLAAGTGHLFLGDDNYRMFKGFGSTRIL
jgi:hypothetical protein